MDDALYRDHDDMLEEHWWFVGRRAVVRDVLSRRLGGRDEHRRIVDIGCGTGGMLDVLLPFGAVEGMDFSEDAIARCRARYGSLVGLRVGGIPEALPKPGTADVACAFDVIEHIDDDVAALRAVRTSLRPGGTLIVTVPAFAFLWSEHDDLNHHKRRYTRASLQRSLVAAGFKVDRISYYNTWLFPVVAAVRLTRKSKATSRGRSDFDLPSPPVNRALAWLFGSERFLLRRADFPFGVSLVAQATAPE